VRDFRRIFMHVRRNFASGTDLRAALLPFLAALLAQWAIGSGALACDGLADGPTGTVTAVPDGNRVVLDSGIAVRLIGTRAPLALKPQAATAPDPHAEAARLFRSAARRCRYRAPPDCHPAQR